MKTRRSILRRTTSFDIVGFGAFLKDDERMFKLSSSASIHTEVGLEGLIDLHAFRNVEKGSSAPYGSMKGRKLVI